MTGPAPTRKWRKLSQVLAYLASGSIPRARISNAEIIKMWGCGRPRHRENQNGFELVKQAAGLWRRR